jgi:hypothetical protein
MSELGFFEEPGFDNTGEDAIIKGQEELAFLVPVFVHYPLRSRLYWRYPYLVRSCSPCCFQYEIAEEI